MLKHVHFSYYFSTICVRFNSFYNQSYIYTKTGQKWGYPGGKVDTFYTSARLYFGKQEKVSSVHTGHENTYIYSARAARRENFGVFSFWIITKGVLRTPLCTHPTIFVSVKIKFLRKI